MLLMTEVVVTDLQLLVHTVQAAGHLFHYILVGPQHRPVLCCVRSHLCMSALLIDCSPQLININWQLADEENLL